MTNHSDLVAAFLARGGAVRVVSESEGANLSGRDWRELTTGARRSAASDDGERVMEQVREAYHAGGRFAAIEALNDYQSR